MQMKRGFKIISNTDSYEISGKSVYGELFIQCEDAFFPYENWGDLIASCLSMWLERLKSFSKGPVCSKAEFYFMDGPHFFVAEKLSGNKLELCFYSYEKLVFTAATDLSNFLLEIKKVANQILSTLSAYDGVEYNIAELKKHLAQV